MIYIVSIHHKFSIFNLVHNSSSFLKGRQELCRDFISRGKRKTKVLQEGLLSDQKHQETKVIKDVEKRFATEKKNRTDAGACEWEKAKGI